MLDSARWYTEHGIAVFPCKPRDKRPITDHGFHDATTDPAKVTAWWTDHPEANIGIPTGKTSGLLVVDVDPRNGGPADRGELIEKFGPIPATCEVITGGGGRHLFFRHPGGAVPKALCEGIDLKGDGGYVIAPPSVHPSGKRYEVDDIDGAAAFLNVAEAPAWLVDRIREAAKPSSGGASTGEADIPEGKRNASLASLAGSMRRRGMKPESITAALLAENASRCRPPLSESEVRQIAASVGKYEPGPAAENPAHDAERPHLKVIEIPSVSTITGGDIKFLVDGLILEGGITMFSGPAGCGKTTLAAAIGGHVACGVPFAGRAVQQRPVLYLDRENPLQVVQERLYRLGMTDGEALRWWGGWLQDEAPSPTAAAVLEWIASLDVMPLLVMDSAVAFLGGR